MLRAGRRGRRKRRVARCGQLADCARSWRGLRDPLGADSRTGSATRVLGAVDDASQTWVEARVGARECRWLVDDCSGSWAKRGTWTTQSEPWQKPDFRKQLGMVGGIEGQRAVARRIWGRNPRRIRRVARAHPNAAMPIRSDVASRAGVAGSGGRRCGDGQRGFADLAGSCLPEGGIES